jgi:hypothetical protein
LFLSILFLMKPFSSILESSLRERNILINSVIINKRLKLGTRIIPLLVILGLILILI